MVGLLASERYGNGIIQARKGEKSRDGDSYSLEPSCEKAENGVHEPSQPQFHGAMALRACALEANACHWGIYSCSSGEIAPAVLPDPACSPDFLS